MHQKGENISKGHIQYDLTYMLNLMNKIEPEVWTHRTEGRLSEGKAFGVLDERR